jgi:hypothetical protein
MMRRIFFILCIILFFIISAYAEEKFNSPDSSNQYSRLLCGEKGVAWDVATIPQIGCFALSPGKSATGTFLGTIIKVSVDANGKEVITADGKPAPDDSRQSSLKVNNMYVKVGGVAGAMFCEDSNGVEGDCVASIDVMSNNPDKSVNFDVSKCLKGKEMVCAGNQEVWDYVKSGDAQKDRDANNAFLNQGKTPEERDCEKKLFVYMMALGGGGADQETENYREQVMAQWKKELPKDATICDMVKKLESIMFPQGSPLEANKNTAQNVKEKELDSIKYLKQINEINKERENLCRKKEYNIIFVKTACMPENITSEQLSNKSVITDTEKVVYLKYYEETLALRKKMFDLLQVSEKPKDKEYLLFLKKEHWKADKMVNDLLERKISWGNFNKFKKDDYEEIIRERNRISHN